MLHLAIQGKQLFIELYIKETKLYHFGNCPTIFNNCCLWTTNLHI